MSSRRNGETLPPATGRAGFSMLEVLLSLTVMSIGILAMMSMNKLGMRSQKTIGLELDQQRLLMLATQVLSSPDACSVSVGIGQVINFSQPTPVSLYLARRNPDDSLGRQDKAVIATGLTAPGSWRVLELTLNPSGVERSPCGSGCWDTAMRMTLRRPEHEEARGMAAQNEVIREFPVRIELASNGGLVRCQMPMASTRTIASAVSCPPGQYLRGISTDGSAICDTPTGGGGGPPPAANACFRFQFTFPGIASCPANHQLVIEGGDPAPPLATTGGPMPGYTGGWSCNAPGTPNPDGTVRRGCNYLECAPPGTTPMQCSAAPASFPKTVSCCPLAVPTSPPPPEENPGAIGTPIVVQPPGQPPGGQLPGSPPGHPPIQSGPPIRLPPVTPPRRF